MTKYHLAAVLVIAGTLFTVLTAADPVQGEKTGISTKKYAEFSAVPQISTTGETNMDELKLKYLSGKKLDVLQKMHETRIRLIKKDSRLATLRKRILSLTLELSQELNAKREMIELNNALAVIEDEIKILAEKQKEAAEKQKDAAEAEKQKEAAEKQKDAAEKQKDAAEAEKQKEAAEKLSADKNDKTDIQK